MSKICEICGKKPVAGRTIVRRGLAKKKGGVGLKITGINPRRFLPNLKTVRAIAETGVHVISAGALTHSAPAVDFSLLITEEKHGKGIKN
jgi:large subunit ribosomal protein L28